MAPLSPTARHASPDDELDDILNGIIEGRDVAPASTAQTQANTSKRRPADTTGALGIDDEIVITKKRIPIPKLNDERLLSDAGIPRLRKISKERLRFKGKGHEYGDIARLLNMYQLWLDDLYPRAKFADALSMVEKAGHTKRMHIMRKDWIDEGKPRRTTEMDEDDVAEAPPTEAPARDSADTMEGTEDSTRSNQAALSQRERPPQGQTPTTTTPQMGDDPDEDELDALLAESAPDALTMPTTLPSRTKDTNDDPFADEMEAMADMDDMW
ncbi:Swi3-domain-containing protein [Plenodomus tracheiphilus IPT5]|uniref:Chromosome segregation in meiosis protein n=1 Tax=Plenodomus tracheiphilus IPT5 TaxID=1408161 RepID=A0A6A7BBP1_9PLEO|nr:Swi3-domain-containing protein [Plenodomus tracheiphilus IPT5]